MAVAKTTSNGASAPSTGIHVTNPITSEVIGTIALSSREDVATVVETVRQAQNDWASRPVADRVRIIRKFGDLVWQNKDAIIETLRQETGKNLTSAYAEIFWVDNAVNYYTVHGPRLLQPERRPPLIPLIQRAKVYHKPRGVIGFITPWNYPVGLAMIDMVPALIAGNTIVIKPSEVAPYALLKVIDLLYEAGLPPHVLQVVTGDGTTGAALVDKVDYVCFTGSTATGRKVAAQAAEHLKPYSLELGGKDAMIVLADADLDLAANAAMLGATENVGQACTAVERVYVEAAIYDEFVAKVKKYAGQVKIGTGGGFDTHMGSLTNERELLRMEAHIQDAVNKGAEVIFGGQRLPEFGPLFVRPAILTHVDHSMAIMTEETFGPTIPIMKVSNADEAIRLANASEYGLLASIFTRDLDKGERLATRLQVGGVTINRSTAALQASTHLPWGGEKNSGIGRRGGPEGIMRFTTPQSVLVDTQIGTQPALHLLDPLTLNTLLVLRVLRRWLPFL